MMWLLWLLLPWSLLARRRNILWYCFSWEMKNHFLDNNWHPFLVLNETGILSIELCVCVCRNDICIEWLIFVFVSRIEKRTNFSKIYRPIWIDELDLGKKIYERKREDMTEVIDQSSDSLSCFLFYLNRRSLISCVCDTIRYDERMNGRKRKTNGDHTHTYIHGREMYTRRELIGQANWENSSCFAFTICHFTHS